MMYKNVIHLDLPNWILNFAKRKKSHTIKFKYINFLQIPFPLTISSLC